MSIVYAVEKWGDVWQEMAHHWPAHHAEVAMDHEAVPLDIDLEAYHALAAHDVLHVVTARDGGTLVGYHLSLIRTHIRYKSTLHAMVDIYYLAPEYRKGLTGYLFLRYVEQTWKARGVRKAFTASKIHLDVRAVHERLGWRQTEILYSKVLKE